MTHQTAILALAYLASIEADAIADIQWTRDLTADERATGEHLRELSAKANQDAKASRKEQKLAHDWIHAKMQQLELF